MIDTRVGHARSVMRRDDMKPIWGTAWDAVLDDSALLSIKHDGPGAHDNGTPQSVHGGDSSSAGANVARGNGAPRSQTLADAPEWEDDAGNVKGLGELTRADFGFPQIDNFFGGYKVENDSPAGWVMRNLMGDKKKYAWGSMLKWGTMEAATRAMDEAYARLQRELKKQAVTGKASDWRNTPGQINARYKLGMHKIRTAGIPQRFTRGKTRQLQAGVLRANALARAVKHGGNSHHKTGTPQMAHAGARAQSKWARVEDFPRVGRRVEDVVAMELGALFGMGENLEREGREIR